MSPSDKHIVCGQCGGAFPDLVEGKLRTLWHRLVAERIAVKERCQGCFEAYRKTAELCRAHLMKHPHPEFGDRLVQFLRQHTGKGER